MLFNALTVYADAAAPAAGTAGAMGAQPAGAAGMLASFVPLILMFVIFWFILIRPQKKREKELKNMIAALKVGDEVATIGGIHGKIVKVKDELFVIESGAGTNKSTITVDRGSVARYLKRGSEKDVELIEEAPETTEE